MTQDHFRLTWHEVVAWAIGRRKRFNIGGASMHPLLKQDDDVLMRTYRKDESINTGDIVIARHPIRKNLLIVKQIVHADSKNDQYHLAGMNLDESTDSRTFGFIRAEHIIGKMTAVFLSNRSV